jgi:hypothetical protein
MLGVGRMFLCFKPPALRHHNGFSPPPWERGGGGQSNLKYKTLTVPSQIAKSWAGKQHSFLNANITIKFCKYPECDKMIDYLLFYVPLKNISLIWRRHHCWWRAAKFRPMLGAQGLWAGRDLYRATPNVTRDLGFFGLIRRTAPFSRLLRHARGSRGPIPPRILTGVTKWKINPS